MLALVLELEWVVAGLLLSYGGHLSGQEPKHMWPLKNEYGSVGFLTMSWPHRMDVEGWVVGSGGIVGKEGVVLMALPVVISQRGMNIKGRVVVVVVIVGSL